MREALAGWAPWVGMMSLVAGAACGETAQEVSPCSLRADPASYDHKLVEITGFISHGFEDFSLFDPACTARFGIWLEYGGKKSSGTIYCCVDASDRSRRRPLRVEGVSIPLLRDEIFDRFDDLIQRNQSILVHATLIGRFFAGHAQESAGRSFLRGYGHLGYCSLLAIQQVRSVDPVDRKDVDYDPNPDQPDISQTGCGYRDLIGPGENHWIEAQHNAEERPSCAFDDPERVAEQAVEESAGFPGSPLTEIRRDQSRVVYTTAVAAGATYMVVVSRPYLVTFYARDPTRIAWIAIAVFETFCESPADRPGGS